MMFDKYIGIPFKDRGRTIEGLDCWGLIVLVYRELFSIELPSFSNDYQSAMDRESIQQTVLGHMSPWIEVEGGREEVGDGILMRGKPYHMGIVAFSGRMLHIEDGIFGGSRIEPYMSPLWANRIIGFYRYGNQT